MTMHNDFSGADTLHEKGHVLADLVSRWIACHPPEQRAAALDQWLKLVTALVPEQERITLEGREYPKTEQEMIELLRAWGFPIS